MNTVMTIEEMLLPKKFYEFGYLQEQNVLVIKPSDLAEDNRLSSDEEDDDVELHLDAIEALCLEEVNKFLSTGEAASSSFKTKENLPFYELRNPSKEEEFFKCHEKIGELFPSCWTAEDAKRYSKKEVPVCYPTTRVFYELGSLQSLSKISIASKSANNIKEVGLKIADDWSKKLDIRNEEEEAYPAPYAQRVLLEKYGVNNK